MIDFISKLKVEKYEFLHLDENLKIRNFNVEYQKYIVFPGSFNPLHEGHIELLLCGMFVSQKKPVFEISISNVSKPDLNTNELEERILQFKGLYEILITDEPTFFKKSRLFKGADFLIGGDTFMRLFDMDFYPDINSKNKISDNLKILKENGTRFIIGGRNVDGEFVDINSLEIPNDLEGMFVGIPKDVFDSNISSNKIRKQMRDG